jgi:HPt (histidine-containing phosphotransfer) domain-containing protein
MASDDDDEDESVVYYLEDGKLHFTEEGLRHFTEEERGQLVELHEQLGKKFDEICDQLAKQLGHGDLATLSAGSKAQIVKEAEDLTEQWDSEPEMSDDPKIADQSIRPEPALQTLLAEHHELCERILDIQDDADAREFGDEDDEEEAA